MNADAILQKIAETPQTEVTALLQKLYAEPIKDSLVAARVRSHQAGQALPARYQSPRRTPNDWSPSPLKRAWTSLSCNPQSRPPPTSPRVPRDLFSPSCASR